MRIYNSLTHRVENFKPLTKGNVTIYSCGPTVYDHAHIGNLSAFIVADTLYRTLTTQGYSVRRAMNFTDVDDKTIRRSREAYSDLAPHEALTTLTRYYEKIFMSDMQNIGNDTNHISFLRATDNIPAIQDMINKLLKVGVAYIRDDGVYFSIQKYVEKGYIYGKLLQLSDANISNSRINNDEYDKDSIHDFALWKVQKDDEPAWELVMGDRVLVGRPGWHIECSAMSEKALGRPFDIHTGGIDLVFPHHENEIAQSTACGGSNILASYFVHNEHILVDGKKMSKSLGNFYTLDDIQEHGYDPLALRILVMQAHYRNQVNFTWASLKAAQNRLQELRSLAALRFQARKKHTDSATFAYEEVPHTLSDIMANDLDTPMALAYLSDVSKQIHTLLVSESNLDKFIEMLSGIDALLGTDLMAQKNISAEQEALIMTREAARRESDWERSDDVRSQLLAQGITVRDTVYGTVWARV